MSALFKRPSVADEEMSRIQRDVASLDRDIRYLSTHLPQETMRDMGATAGGKAAGPGASGWLLLPFGRKPRSAAGRSRGAAGDGRLPDLLSGSVDAMRRVTVERRLARNRGVVLAAFGLMWLVWLMARLK
jgi:hypothetical protein